jgi:hypothetical protein
MQGRGQAVQDSEGIAQQRNTGIPGHGKLSMRGHADQDRAGIVQERIRSLGREGSQGEEKVVREVKVQDTVVQVVQAWQESRRGHVVQEKAYSP